MSQLIKLECDHCGGTAITSLYGDFHEGQGDHCETCRMPGSVTLSETYNENDEEVVTAYWSSHLVEGDYCNRPDCEACAAAREEAGE